MQMYSNGCYHKKKPRQGMLGHATLMFLSVPVRPDGDKASLSVSSHRRGLEAEKSGIKRMVHERSSADPKNGAK